MNFLGTNLLGVLFIWFFIVNKILAQFEFYLAVKYLKITSAYLDVQFDEEARVMPLMSAAKVWSDLKTTVMDRSLFKTINNLLFVQVIL